MGRVCSSKKPIPREAVLLKTLTTDGPGFGAPAPPCIVIHAGGTLDGRTGRIADLRKDQPLSSRLAADVRLFRSAEHGSARCPA